MSPYDICVIWSGEHGSFWRPGSAGYTRAYSDAGLFPRHEAESIIAHCGAEKRVELIAIKSDMPLPLKGIESIPGEALILRAVRGARLPRGKRGFRWAAVMHVFALGSTYAGELCLKHGLDPDELVPPLPPKRIRASKVMAR